MKAWITILLLSVSLTSSANSLTWSDIDKDGVPDNKDACPNTQIGASVDASGCERQIIESFCLPTTSGETYPAHCQKITPIVVTFDFASAQVDYSQWRYLAELQSFLNQYPATLCIVGHADNVGEAEFNQTLSYDRAVNVTQILVEDYQFSPQRFSVVGQGSTQPIADNQTDAGRALNRRVEFIVESH
ncbi:OmpA family protein [Shewanella mesophila]|uniref:OmpA family protein n=1 Tax=Shewanella mesophila TaxID=2864208 RepID=UPI001C656C63|nr:OmpA family protein [Shewanella mesophila]QYJ85210.1 OmpA family protein [Shewanella mesophila]